MRHGMLAMSPDFIEKYEGRPAFPIVLRPLPLMRLEYSMCSLE